MPVDASRRVGAPAIQRRSANASLTSATGVSCAACGAPLFTSAMKFDSGTGWPSFFATLPGAFATQTDRRHAMMRTEYHCARCGSHHGHVFDDGPQPSGQRWCNNGVALRFVPEGEVG